MQVFGRCINPRYCGKCIYCGRELSEVSIDMEHLLKEHLMVIIFQVPLINTAMKDLKDLLKDDKLLMPVFSLLTAMFCDLGALTCSICNQNIKNVHSLIRWDPSLHCFRPDIQTMLYMLDKLIFHSRQGASSLYTINKFRVWGCAKFIKWTENERGFGASNMRVLKVKMERELENHKQKLNRIKSQNKKDKIDGNRELNHDINMIDLILKELKKQPTLAEDAQDNAKLMFSLYTEAYIQINTLTLLMKGYGLKPGRPTMLGMSAETGKAGSLSTFINKYSLLKMKLFSPNGFHWLPNFTEKKPKKAADEEKILIELKINDWCWAPRKTQRGWSQRLELAKVTEVHDDNTKNVRYMSDNLIGKNIPYTEMSGHFTMEGRFENEFNHLPNVKLLITETSTEQDQAMFETMSEAKKYLNNFRTCIKKKTRKRKRNMIGGGGDFKNKKIRNKLNKKTRKNKRKFKNKKSRKKK